MSGESDRSGLQGPRGDGQVETCFVISVDGEYFDSVKEVLSSINATMAGFGTNVRVGVAVPVGTCTLTSARRPTAEENKKIAGIIETALRERFVESGKNLPITVTAAAETI